MKMTLIVALIMGAFFLLGYTTEMVLIRMNW